MTIEEKAKEVFTLKEDYGSTYGYIAKEIGEALGRSEDFILFCYWYQEVYGKYLEELDTILEQYYINDEWREYRRQFD